MLSLHKWMSLKQISDVTGLPAIVAAKFTDGICYTLVGVMPELSIGGRTDRADWQDVEPVVLIPIAYMKPVAADQKKPQPVALAGA